MARQLTPSHPFSSSFSDSSVGAGAGEIINVNMIPSAPPPSLKGQVQNQLAQGEAPDHEFTKIPSPAPPLQKAP